MKIINIDLEDDFKKFAKTVEGPFKISRNIKERAFELKLPKGTGIFSVFEEKLLIKANSQKKIQQIWNRKTKKESIRSSEF